MRQDLAVKTREHDAEEIDTRRVDRRAGRQSGGCFDVIDPAVFAVGQQEILNRSRESVIHAEQLSNDARANETKKTRSSLPIAGASMVSIARVLVKLAFPV